MSIECDGCKSAHTEILHLKRRVGTLESFKKWAEPILNDIKLLRNDTRWMIIIALAFIGTVAWIYAYQVYPLMKQQSIDKIDIIKEIHEMEKISYEGRQELKLELVKKFNQSTETINKHSTDISKKSVSRLRSTLYNQRDDIKEAISQKPSINVNQRVGN